MSQFATDFNYNMVKDSVHVHDLNATIHTKLTYRYQGRHFRLTDVHGRIVNEVLA